MPKMNPPEREGFGGYLRALRRSRGMTQRELATASRVNFTYISKLENNRLEHGPSEAVCVMLAQALQSDSWEMLVAAGKLPTPLLEALSYLDAGQLRSIYQRIWKGQV